MNQRGSKHAFWQALIFTLFVFGFGFLFGFAFEEGRSSGLEERVINSEINLLDEQLRAKIVEDLEIGCDSSINGLFKFADEVFLEALNLEKYDGASTFSDDLTLLHRRYDLLRLLMWQEAVGLRERCGSDFHTIVYLFDYKSEDAEVKGEQAFFSRFLTGIKEDNPEDILLLPIAGNLGLDSVDLVLEKYDIERLPAIIVDEEHVVNGVLTSAELEEIIFG